MSNSQDSSNRMADSGNRLSYGDGAAMREPSTKGEPALLSPFALMRLAKRADLGAKKYASRNWEKGMPYSRYLSAAMRHLFQYQMGMRDEDHLAAAMWNIHCIMHHEEVGDSQWDDLPKYTEQIAENAEDDKQIGDLGTEIMKLIYGDPEEADKE